MKVFLALLTILLILSGCGSKVYPPGEYTVDDFKDVDYRLHVTSIYEEENFNIYIKYNSSDDYQFLGSFNEGDQISIPLASPLVEGFKIEGGNFEMKKNH